MASISLSCWTLVWQGGDPRFLWPLRNYQDYQASLLELHRPSSPALTLLLHCWLDQNSCLWELALLLTKLPMLRRWTPCTQCFRKRFQVQPPSPSPLLPQLHRNSSHTIIYLVSFWRIWASQSAGFKTYQNPILELGPEVQVKLRAGPWILTRTGCSNWSRLVRCLIQQRFNVTDPSSSY